MSEPTGFTFDVDAWLDETMRDGTVRADRICFLYVANNGFHFQGWGSIDCFEGHQLGLTQDEAIEWVYITGFINGLMSAGIDVAGPIRLRLRQYLVRLGLTPMEVGFAGSHDGTVEMLTARLASERKCLQSLEQAIAAGDERPSTRLWLEATKAQIRLLTTRLAAVGEAA